MKENFWATEEKREEKEQSKRKRFSGLVTMLCRYIFILHIPHASSSVISILFVGLFWYGDYCFNV